MQAAMTFAEYGSGSGRVGRLLSRPLGAIVARDMLQAIRRQA